MNINGIIIKGIGGFYYVEATDGIVYECKARGVFRKEKITPLAGDRVEITVESNNKNSIDKILERRNFFKRPPIANIDTLVIVSSVCDPRPNLLIIDTLSRSLFLQKTIFKAQTNLLRYTLMPASKPLPSQTRPGRELRRLSR